MLPSQKRPLLWSQLHHWPQPHGSLRASLSEQAWHACSSRDWLCCVIAALKVKHPLGHSEAGTAGDSEHVRNSRLHEISVHIKADMRVPINLFVTEVGLLPTMLPSSLLPAAAGQGVHQGPHFAKWTSRAACWFAHACNLPSSTPSAPIHWHCISCIYACRHSSSHGPRYKHACRAKSHAYTDCQSHLC